MCGSENLGDSMVCIGLHGDCPELLCICSIASGIGSPQSSKKCCWSWVGHHSPITEARVNIMKDIDSERLRDRISEDSEGKEQEDGEQFENDA